ncbi:MAG: hypothetical protein AB7F86_01330 [Bdellovibrionales bacterium]
MNPTTAGKAGLFALVVGGLALVFFGSRHGGVAAQSNPFKLHAKSRIIGVHGWTLGQSLDLANYKPTDDYENVENQTEYCEKDHFIQSIGKARCSVNIEELNIYHVTTRCNVRSKEDSSRWVTLCLTPSSHQIYKISGEFPSKTPEVLAVLNDLKQRYSDAKRSNDGAMYTFDDDRKTLSLIIEHPFYALSAIDWNLERQAAEEIKSPPPVERTVASTTIKATVKANGIKVFKICDDQIQNDGGIVASQMVRDLSIKSVGVLYDTTGQHDEFANKLRSVFEQTSKTAGIAIESSNTFIEGDFDFKAQLTMMRSRKPDAVLVIGYRDSSNKILDQSRQLGLQQPIIYLGCVPDEQKNMAAQTEKEESEVPKPGLLGVFGSGKADTKGVRKE